MVRVSSSNYSKSVGHIEFDITDRLSIIERISSKTIVQLNKENMNAEIAAVLWVLSMSMFSLAALIYASCIADHDSNHDSDHDSNHDSDHDTNKIITSH